METEIKSLLEKQGEAFAAFKATVNDELAQLKRGAADVVTSEKLGRVNDALDKLGDQIKQCGTRADEIEAKANRLALGGGAGDEVEAKAAAEFARQTQRPVTVQDLRAYKSALYGMAGPLRNVRVTEDEAKAMSVGSDPDGGYLVTPDTSGRIVSRIYETSPMRQVASVMSIGTDSVEGLNDLGENGFAWVGETPVRTENSTAQLGKWAIVVHEAVSVVSATQKVLEDARLDLESWLAMKSADRIARGENAAFVTGNGISKPRGFTDYPTAATADASRAWGTLEHLNTGASGAFRTRSGDTNPVDDLINVIYALKSPYRGNARWMTSRAVLRDARKLKDGQGNFIWQPAATAGQPSSLLGFPVAEAEDMPALASGSLSMAFGDFREGYQIVDRVGLSVLRDPYTAYPYVFFKFRKRVGGGVVNFEAIKFLRFGT
jgi:HK97 family phage major capsid protein